MKLTPTEKRVLLSIYLQGRMGKCGSMNQQQRSKLLSGLLEKGLLDSSGNVTSKGIESVQPNFN